MTRYISIIDINNTQSISWVEGTARLVFYVGKPKYVPFKHPIITETANRFREIDEIPGNWEIT